MRGFIVSVLMGVVAAVCSVAVMPFLATNEGVGIVIPALVLLLMSARPSRVLVFALSTGVVLDSYAFYAFEGHTLRLCVLAVIASFLFTRWFTNRSVYTGMALALLLTGIDQAFGAVVYAFQNTSGLYGWSWAGFVSALVFHAFVTALGFILTGFFSKRLSLTLDRPSSPFRYG